MRKALQIQYLQGFFVEITNHLLPFQSHYKTYLRYQLVTYSYIRKKGNELHEMA
jgi:hypothetical protein